MDLDTNTILHIVGFTILAFMIYYYRCQVTCVCNQGIAGSEEEQGAGIKEEMYYRRGRGCGCAGRCGGGCGCARRRGGGCGCCSRCRGPRCGCCPRCR